MPGMIGATSEEQQAFYQLKNGQRLCVFYMGVRAREKKFFFFFSSVFRSFPLIHSTNITCGLCHTHETLQSFKNPQRCFTSQVPPS